jgi:hypothetical protein
MSDHLEAPTALAPEKPQTPLGYEAKRTPEPIHAT